MSDLRYDQFTAGTPTDSRIILHADPSSGALEKCSIDDLSQVTWRSTSMLYWLQQLGSPIKAHVLGLNPTISSGNFAIVAKRLHLYAVPAPAITATGIYASYVSGASFTAANYCGYGLYEADNTTLSLVASTANVGSGFAPNNFSPLYFPFTSPVSLSNKVYWIATLFDYTGAAPNITARATATASGVPSQIFALTPSYQLYAILNGQTSLPSTVAWSALTATINYCAWCGIY